MQSERNIFGEKNENPYSANYKILPKQIKEDITKGKDLCSWIGCYNIVKKTKFLQLACRFYTIFFKTPADFAEIDKLIFKFV